MDQALSAHCGSRVAKSKNRLSGDHPIQSIPAGDLKRERDDLIKSERSNPSGFFNLRKILFVCFLFFFFNILKIIPESNRVKFIIL